MWLSCLTLSASHIFAFSRTQGCSAILLAPYLPDWLSAPPLDLLWAAPSLRPPCSLLLFFLEIHSHGQISSHRPLPLAMGCHLPWFSTPRTLLAAPLQLLSAGSLLSLQYFPPFPVAFPGPENKFTLFTLPSTPSCCHPVSLLLSLHLALLKSHLLCTPM